MSEQEKRSYTPEFKREAVRLVTEQGYKVTEAARNLGINPNVLTRLKNQVTSEGTKAFPGKGRLTPEKEEETFVSMITLMAPPRSAVMEPLQSGQKGVSDTPGN